MNQPPRPAQPSAEWRRPRGVSTEVWGYVQQRSIADHYDAFVADTPLCALDQQFVDRWLPEPAATSEPVVLDLGSGTGRAAIPLAKRGYRVVAIDLSQAMLEHVYQAAAANESTARVHTLKANLVELDCLADSVADHAICLFSTLGMIQGRKNRRRLLAHCARIVRPGGTLMVHVHNRWAALREPGGALRLTQSWLSSRMRRDLEFGDAIYAYRGLSRMFLHRFSRSEISHDLRQTGWEIQQQVNVSIDGSKAVSYGKIPGGFMLHARRKRVPSERST